MTRKLFFRLIVAVVVVGALYRFFTTKSPVPYVHVTGFTMGSIAYNVKYEQPENISYKASIDSLLVVFNQSLSTYIATSEISKLNQTDTLTPVSDMMRIVYEKSSQVFSQTAGAFDPTVGPLVNAWGFGPGKKPTSPDSATIDSLRAFVGFHKIRFSQDRITMRSGMYLDFSAVAKGYAVDLVGLYLESKEVKNYLVEIGGEVRVLGANAEGESWVIGIENPMVARDEQKLYATVDLTDRSMATSGNYRNYYEENGRIIAHTIDPKTGYTCKNHLLSASVFADDCMTADAFATAFMVMGVEKSKAVLEATSLDAFLIFEEGGQILTYASPGIAKNLEEMTNE